MINKSAIQIELRWLLEGALININILSYVVIVVLSDECDAWVNMGYAQSSSSQVCITFIVRVTIAYYCNWINWTIL